VGEDKSLRRIANALEFYMMRLVDDTIEWRAENCVDCGSMMVELTEDEKSTCWCCGHQE